MRGMVRTPCSHTSYGVNDAGGKIWQFSVTPYEQMW
jgi:hypothetical protein